MRSAPNLPEIMEDQISDLQNLYEELYMQLQFREKQLEGFRKTQRSSEFSTPSKSLMGQMLNT